MSRKEPKRHFPLFGSVVTTNVVAGQAKIGLIETDKNKKELAGDDNESIWLAILLFGEMARDATQAHSHEDWIRSAPLSHLLHLQQSLIGLRRRTGERFRFFCSFARYDFQLS